MTYGFVVFFGRKPYQRGMCRQPRASMYALGVTPVSVVRIDDRYMAQRNVPGMQTLAGKHLVVVGCGTIGVTWRTCSSKEAQEPLAVS